MSKKVNKISINKLESTMTNNVISFPMNGYPDIEVTVRRVLPLHDVMQFVADVGVHVCGHGDRRVRPGGTGFRS